MTEVATFLFSAIRVSTPLVFAAIAAVITQQAGLLNMAVESMMLSAALAGVMISGATQSAILGVLGGVFFAVLIAMVIWYSAFILKCDLYGVHLYERRACRRHCICDVPGHKAKGEHHWLCYEPNRWDAGYPYFEGYSFLWKGPVRPESHDLCGCCGRFCHMVFDL